MKTLSHPHIVPILAKLTSLNKVVIVMPFASLGDLASYLVCSVSYTHLTLPTILLV